MTNTRISQTHQVILTGGSPPPAISQSHEVVLLTVGSVPTVVSQTVQVILVPAFEPQLNIRRRGFMSFRP